MSLRAVPDRQDPDVYGHIDFFDGLRTHRLSIGIDYGDRPDFDIALDRNGKRLRHPFHGSGPSTEEERAAVGWAW